MDTVIDHLRTLVAFDTQNPPRRAQSSGIFAYLREQLPDFVFEVSDEGDGCVSLLAQRGRAPLLFNVHIDTVPRPQGDTDVDPFTLRIEGGRAWGLGACDIKGAAACLLAVAQATKEPMAILFNSDEEAGTSRCIRRFVARERNFDAVLVAEPTQCRARVGHRGIASASVEFWGRAAHASQARPVSAVHRALQWGALLAQTDLDDLRLNIGRIEGGSKPNVVAQSCRLRIGMRPPSGVEPGGALEQVIESLGEGRPDHWEPSFVAPSLPRDDAARAGADRLVAELGLPVGPDVDFWTEAALFSHAGWNALVYGPGNIAQAHTADEWVELVELERAYRDYKKIVRSKPLRDSAKLVVAHRWDEVDLTRLVGLLQHSFARELTVENLGGTPVHRVYVGSDYQTAAIVRADGPAPWLDKFAVAPALRGQGRGRVLWERLCADFPLFFWRARHENPINAFYRKQATGFVGDGAWTFFWHGRASLAQVARCRDWAQGVPFGWNNDTT